MTVENLKDKLNLEIICDGNNLSCEIEGCYATDLLSLAMAIPIAIKVTKEIRLTRERFERENEIST